MANELKNLIVKEQILKYGGRSNYLVVGYQGIKALEFDQIRRDLRKKNVHLEIVKNSLTILAFKQIGLAGGIDLLKGPSAIIAGQKDPVVTAKETVEWSKKIPSMALRGGYVDGVMLSADEIKELSTLPDLPVLRTQIVTGMNAPIVGVVNAFNSVLRGLVTVLQAVKEKKEKSGE
ncbi:MAG: 50S ribosomal protein L10 [Candidatus Loosdrechtia sp.]|uniref:50S ribosomal protein L10 n=1 Tax=Candidatus Loosdrechtia sp. TaxID=3101272 RepID=UPI003A6E4611|nr:MAG: 50S ribosomal protein L10 [Candidatus Jettenia sp. AMX2]